MAPSASQLVATCATGLFTGASLHISISELPSNLALGNEHCSKWFPQMFSRAAKSQASLTVISSVAAALHAYALSKAAATSLRGGSGGSSSGIWYLAAVLMGANMPYTLIGMMNHNRKIIEAAKAGKSSPLGEFVKWGKMHAVRTGLGLVSLAIMLYYA